MAVNTILFYDYLLTLPDEVSCAASVTSCLAYRPGERSNTLGVVGGNHGVRREHRLLYHIR